MYYYFLIIKPNFQRFLTQIFQHVQVRREIKQIHALKDELLFQILHLRLSEALQRSTETQQYDIEENSSVALQ